MRTDDARIAQLVTVAHRAGNDVARAAQAAELGADVIEADLHSYRGRLEVRHLKTLGPLPLLWDRWRLSPGWTKRVLLSGLCEELSRSRGPGLMFDLKGRDPRIATAVVDAAERLQGMRSILVCGQNWTQLEPLLDAPNIGVLHSVGNRTQLSSLWESQQVRRGRGVSIHRRLLSADVLRRIKEIAPFVTTWPINDEATLALVTKWGVDGITTDSDAILRRVATARMRVGAGAPHRP